MVPAPDGGQQARIRFDEMDAALGHNDAEAYSELNSRFHRTIAELTGMPLLIEFTARTFDYFSTLNLRRRGDQEILLTNEIVDNHAAFAAIEAAGTGVWIGASYLFHHYGHHKLERWTSIVHFGLTTSGAVRNYCLKTAHPKIAP